MLMVQDGQMRLLLTYATICSYCDILRKAEGLSFYEDTASGIRSGSEVVPLATAHFDLRRTVGVWGGATCH